MTDKTVNHTQNILNINFLTSRLKGPTVNVGANKMAMSRALGAAFLNHQVEQLEKSVSNVNPGNWRDRRQTQTEHAHPNGRAVVDRAPKRLPNAQGGKPLRKKAGEAAEKAQERNEIRSRPRLSEEPRKGEKDADIVVVDSSVLVNALYQVKKWCRDGREEIVIVPLEGAHTYYLIMLLQLNLSAALNTLDLLKKGTSPLAQRARAASRILEAQVGTNSRIRVQRDDAFVLWDNITFKDPAGDVNKDKSVAPFSNQGNAPEWVRRTVCCARWETDNADASGEDQKNAGSQSPKVVLAVLASTPQISDQAHQSKRSDGTIDISSPVPLPAPSPHANKYEPRTAGTLVHQWAARAGISMIEIQPSAPAPVVAQQASSHPRTPIEDDRPKRQGGRGRKNSHASPGPGGASGAGHSSGGSGLVERPPAVMAMMEMVSQPSKVVRVLARGEKLDPDP